MNKQIAYSTCELIVVLLICHYGMIRNKQCDPLTFDPPVNAIMVEVTNGGSMGCFNTSGLFLTESIDDGVIGITANNIAKCVFNSDTNGTWENLRSWN